MNRRARRQWLAYAGVLFLCGAVSGAVFSWAAARHRGFEHGRPGGGPPSGDHLCDHLRDGLQREFSLDETQLRSLAPLLERRAQQLDASFARSRQDFARVAEESDNEIAAALHLTPQQRARLPELSRPPGFGPGRPPGRGPEHDRDGDRDHERPHPRPPLSE